jgi:hypothetical protein
VNLPSPHMIKLTGKQWLTAAIVVVLAVLAFKLLVPEKERPAAEDFRRRAISPGSRGNDFATPFLRIARNTPGFAGGSNS